MSTVARYLRRRPIGRTFVLAAIATVLCSVGLPPVGVVRAAADTADPIVGDWNVTYGAPAVVTMTLSGGLYTVTAKTPVEVTGATCFLPVGTTIATFSSTGPNAYSGQHGLWYISDCSFGYWDPMTLTLSSDGNTLTAVLAGGYGTVIFTKGANGQCSPPQNVRDGALYGDGNGGGDVQVRWDAPTSQTCGAIDHYEIVNIRADGSIGDTVDSVADTGAPSYTDYVTGLKLCFFYKFGVVAVGVNGQKSVVAHPSNSAFTIGPPKSSPPVITIIIQGVGSSVEGSNWNPLSTFYCTSQFGDNSTIQTGTTQGKLAYDWLNVSDAGNGDYAGPGAGNNLIDSVASTGGLVLPLSYVPGTKLTGTAASPMFTVPSYGPSDVINTNPNEVAGHLNSLIGQINTIFPNAKIIVVGHSNGGVVAQQWWANNTSFSPGPQNNVAQVFTLDSPVNGLYAGTICANPNGISKFALCTTLQFFGSVFGLGVTSKLMAYYGRLWSHQSTNDQYWSGQDAANQMWTPFVTMDDPLFDAADYAATPQGAATTNIGFASQGLVNQPDCVNSSWQTALALPVRCHLITPDQVNGFTYNDGTSQLFGLPGDAWVHSVVKNNANVIAAVMRYVTG
jgi:hypothetical protein